MTIGERANPLLGFRSERHKYECTWVNHCRICNGVGEIIYSDDPSASGVSLSPGTMEFDDPCICLESSHCPRCGRFIHAWDKDTYQEEFPECPICGWKFRKSAVCPNDNI